MSIFFKSDATLQKQIFSLLATSHCQMQKKLHVGFEPTYPKLLFYLTELSRYNREWDSNPRPIEEVIFWLTTETFKSS